MPFTPFEILSAEATRRSVEDARTGILAEALRQTRLSDAFEGRRMKPEQARRAVLAIIKETAADIASATSILLKTKRLNPWWTRMVKAIIPANLAASLAILGTPEPAPADIESMRGQVNRQGGFLRGFYQEIRNGAHLLGGQTENRASMYADAAWGSAQQVKRDRSIRDDYKQERRMLGQAEHCPDCEGFARLGWQPIGSLPLIGDSRCLSRCKCVFLFR